MIAWLAVRDFAIVSSLELAFEQGLTVLTGETGAGKSIVVDALALLLGGRADPTIIRPGCRAAELQAAFSIGDNLDAARWLHEHDLASDDECVLRRVVAADKPSRAFINGRGVPVQMLRELGSHLADIHGQHEHQSLLRPAVQLRILDEYARSIDAAATLAELSGRLRVLRAKARDAAAQESDRDHRIALLRHELSELEAAGPEPGEYERLDADHKRLAHLHDLSRGTRETLDRLYDNDDGSVYAELSRCLQDIASLSEFDASLSDTAALLEEARVRVTEAREQLRRATAHYDAEPAALERAQQRLSALHDLARKHRVSPEQLADVQHDLGAELERLESDATDRRRVQADMEATGREWDRLAAEISAARRDGARRLSDAVTAEMHDLGMPGGEFRVALNPTDPDQRPASGAETVELQVTTNPGHPPRPLAKIASGGELSRISLAIQVIIAGRGQAPCLVFDEVDVGVGGRTAEVVGRRLRTLGETRQILCVTHLPQVASHGRHHMQVRKRRDAGPDVSVESLDDDGRVHEIARMLGGARITERSIAHAREMLRGAP